MVHTPKSRTKQCALNSCSKPFDDSSPRNNNQYCSVGCRDLGKKERKNEKRWGSAKPPKVPFGWRTCASESCLKPDRLWLPLSTKRNLRCPECREAKRQKECRKCGASYEDKSRKGNRFFCVTCIGEKPERTTRPISARTKLERARRARRALGGPDHFDKLTVGSTTWLGRLGELVLLHSWEGAGDAVQKYGVKCPFDIELPGVGDVNVRTANHTTIRGKRCWPFNTRREKGVSFFLIGLAEGGKQIAQAWLLPEEVVPLSSAWCSPQSQEYAWGPYEVGSVLLSKLNGTLTRILENPSSVSNNVPPETWKLLIGRAGEAIYKTLHPTSFHASAVNFTSKVDFKNADGRTVSVKSVRPSKRTGRWTFILDTSKDVADLAFLVAFSKDMSSVEFMLQVPLSELPARGISVGPKSKWRTYRVFADKTPCAASLLMGDYVKDKSKLASLYRFGLSYRQLQKMFGGSLATIHDRVKAGGGRRPKKRVTKVGDWDLLTKNEQGNRVTEVLAAVFGSPMPPLKTYPSEDALDSVRSDLVFTDGNGLICSLNKRGIGFCNSFFPNRLRAAYYKSCSVEQAWQDPSLMARAVRLLLKSGKPTTLRRVFHALTAIVRAPTSFRPSVAKFVYDTYAPKGGVVWDPCAGYGGRLMGALASGVRYIGTDVEPETVAGNLALADALGKRDLVRVECVPAQEFDPGEVDLVFTSPPYFDRERYSENKAQSWKTFSTVETWVDGFLVPLLTTAFKRSPRLVLNIANLKTRKGLIDLVALTKEAAAKVGWVFVEELKMPLRQLNRSRPFEPVLVFERPFL